MMVVDDELASQLTPGHRKLTKSQARFYLEINFNPLRSVS